MIEMTARKVLDALEVMAGLKMDIPQLALLQSQNGRIKTAILADDAEALSAHATRAVSEALNSAGVSCVLIPKTLRDLVEQDGWALIMDTMDGRENAGAVLKRRIEALQGGSQFAGQQRSAASPSSSEGHRTESARNAEQTASHAPRTNASHGHERAPANGRSAPQERTQPLPRSQHAHDPRAASGTSQSAQRPTLQPPAPQRVNHSDASNGNVRTIGSSPRTRDQHQGNRDQGERRPYDQVKVHGGKHALTIEADTTRRDEPTVVIEAAKALNNDTPRQYDWRNKIAIQLTPAELQHCTAVFHGLIPSVKFQNHGPQQDKWFELVKQDGDYAGTFKLTVGQGSVFSIVQITSADLGNVSSLFRRQCAAQMRESLASLEGALRIVADAYNASQARRPQGSGGGQRSSSGNQRRTG